MRKSTNKLTKHELNFAKSTVYPITKQEIIQKVGVLFQELGKNLCHQVNDHLPLKSTAYKITRGENYKRMPYVVLDYPQLSGNQFPVVCRTLFWWGHYFSCSLLIRRDLIDIEATAKTILKLKKCRIWIGTNLWEHDLKSGEYAKVAKMSCAEIITILEAQPYLKLTAKIPLEAFGSVSQRATAVYADWLKEISFNQLVSE